MRTRVILFVLLYLIILIGCILWANAKVIEVPEVDARMNIAIVGGSATTTTAGGGPDTYYYNDSNCSSGCANNASIISTWEQGDGIQVLSGGTITTVGVDTNLNTGTTVLRICLFYCDGGSGEACTSGTWTLHSSCTLDPEDNQYNDCTLASSYSVDTDEWVYITFNANGNMGVGRDGTSGGHFVDRDDNNCQSTLTISNEYEYGVRVYVD